MDALAPALEGVVVEYRAGVSTSERHNLRGTPGAEVHCRRSGSARGITVCANPELAMSIPTPALEGSVVEDTAGEACHGSRHEALRLRRDDVIVPNDEDTVYLSLFAQIDDGRTREQHGRAVISVNQFLVIQ